MKFTGEYLEFQRELQALKVESEMLVYGLREKYNISHENVETQEKKILVERQEKEDNIPY